jgi:hypothetical protein
VRAASPSRTARSAGSCHAPHRRRDRVAAAPGRVYDRPRFADSVIPRWLSRPALQRPARSRPSSRGSGCGGGAAERTSGVGDPGGEGSEPHTPSLWAPVGGQVSRAHASDAARSSKRSRVRSHQLEEAPPWDARARSYVVGSVVRRLARRHRRRTPRPIARRIRASGWCASGGCDADASMTTSVRAPGDRRHVGTPVRTFKPPVDRAFHASAPQSAANAGVSS